MGSELRQVRLADIDKGDALFRISRPSDLDDLRESIRIAGCVSLPVLRVSATGYTVISGFRRIEAMAALNMDACSAIVHPRTLDDFSAACMAIADNALSRPLHVMEQARALALLQRSGADEERLSAVAPGLGLPGHPGHLRQLLALCGCPDFIREAVSGDVVALPMALALADLDEKDARFFVSLFAGLNAGLNRQRNLFTLFFEIAKREACGVADVAGNEEIAGILNDDECEKPRKLKLLEDWLNRRRYPERSRAVSGFRQAVAALNLPGGMTVSCPDNFESGALEVRMACRDADQLALQKNALEALIKAPGFKALFPR